MAEAASTSASDPARRRTWAIVAVTVGLGAAAIFLAYAGSFVLPVSHPFSFSTGAAGCEPPTTTWRIPAGSMVTGSWRETGTVGLRVNITAPDGAAL